MTQQNHEHISTLIEKMLLNQQNLNTTAYSTTWLDKGKSREWDYEIAATQEIAEFINSYWLPWWSKAEQDMANCRIEIVDALHFLLSQALIYTDSDIGEATQWILESFLDAQDELPNLPKDPLAYARFLQASINSSAPHMFIALFLLCYSIDFNIDQLFALYMGKSELNKFRQDKGYKQGLYKKLWDGKKEDNYFLSMWVGEQETAPTPLMIRAFLETEYEKHASAQ